MKTNYESVDRTAIRTPTDASAGHTEECRYQSVKTASEQMEPDRIDVDRLAAATRADRPPGYRVKHIQGVTS